MGRGGGGAGRGVDAGRVDENRNNKSFPLRTYDRDAPRGCRFLV